MKRTVGQVILVAGLGIGLHWGFRGIAADLPQIFPHLRREQTPAVIPPLLEDEGEATEELPLPEGTVPLKRAGEIPLQPSNRLVQSTQLPELSDIGGVPTSLQFNIPPALVPIVDFWKKIYAVYDTNQVVLHDRDYLEIEYGVVEAGPFQEERVRQEVERVRAILTELDQWRSGEPISQEAKRIAYLFRNLSEPDKYESAKERIRTQTGLRDKFEEGLQRSGRYMPLFEQIFQGYGVPKEITRLAFVESLFKERAFSKVRAAGLWQFMPGTARRYMTVNQWIDERYDPVVATHGAAKLLLRNYELLGTWPLAINAYNSGVGNLQKAVSVLGTKDIAEIITRYKNGSYAFSSRNFYPSFLAALSLYENQEKNFGPIAKDPPLEFDLVQLPSTMTFPEIAYLANTPLDTLKELNPGFVSKVFQGEFAVPSGSQVRIPRGQHELFSSRFVNSSPTIDFSNTAKGPMISKE